MSVPKTFANLVLLHSATNACSVECWAMVSNDLIDLVDGCPADITIREALQIWSLRKQSTERADIESCGFEQTIEQLKQRDPEEHLLQYVLKGEGTTFIVFVDLPQSGVVGCIRVRRGNFPR